MVGLLGVARVALALEVGERAPHGTLPSTTGEPISLSQFRNKKLVLLEFYVNDFGATCTANGLARKADYSQFQDLDVQMLGLSADGGTAQF